MKSIRDDEYAALLMVRDKLAKGELKHVEAAGYYDAVPAPQCFNMDIPARVKDCGTVACIGGWMGLFMFDNNAAQAADYVNNDCEHSPALTELFFPRLDRRCVSSWSDITPAQAVQAIDNFIATDGDPKWSEVCANDTQEENVANG